MVSGCTKELKKAQGAEEGTKQERKKAQGAVKKLPGKSVYLSPCT